jgi:hypothetical protein
LSANGTITSPTFDTDGWKSIEIFIATDVDSAHDNGIVIEYCEDTQVPVPIFHPGPIYRYNSAEVAQGFFRTNIPVSLDGMRITYLNNATTAQSTFYLAINLRTAPVEPPRSSLAAIIDDTNEAATTKGVLVAPNNDLVYETIGRDGEGASINTHVTTIDDDILLQPLPTWRVNQFAVATTAAQIDSTKLTGRRGVQVKNHSPTINLYIGSDNMVSESSGELIPPLSSSSMMLSDAGDIWAICQDAGGVQTTIDRDGTISSGTGGSLSNAYTNNATYATLTAISQTVIISGYSAGTTNAIVSVKIGVKGKKNSTPSTETVTWLGVTTGTSTSSGSVTALSVPAVANTLYIVRIAKESITSTTTGVSGLGLTWIMAGADAVGTDARTSMWYAYGSPTSVDNVVATFDIATNAVISVSRHSNANPVTPLEHYEAITGTGTSYSDSLNGTNLGMLVVGAGFGNTTHTAGSGATERSETTIGSGGSAVTLATTTEENVSTGSQTYAGTFGASTGWAVVAASIVPADTIAPVVTMTYKVSSVLQPTSGTVTLSSTSDTTTLIDITPDRSWVFGDILNVEITGTLSTFSVATALIDWIYLEIVDSTGNIVRGSIKEIA